MTSPRIEVLPAPLGVEEWTKPLLIERLKLAMQVELSTIPLYLYAYYSINVAASMPEDKKVAGANARFAILGIFQQEMLHLTLMGNLLRAVDETPMTLYREAYIPVYPTTILSSNVPMSLTRAGRESFENFLKIEAPYYPPPPPTPPLAASASEIHVRDVLPDEHSIGEFYANLAQGVETVSKKQTDLFNDPRLDLQFGGYMFNRDIQIKDTDSALKAIELVTEQGEGGISIPESHYAIFVDLYHRQQSWTCYDVITDPKSTKYPNGAAKELVLALNASYCYLLVTIETIWTVSSVSDKVHRRYLNKNLHSIMMAVMTPIASLLVQQTVNYEGHMQNAGPCFEYYPSTGQGTVLNQLHQAIKDKLNAAIAQQPSLEDQIAPLLYSVDEVAPFQLGN